VAIIRLIVVDPSPREGIKTDLVVYQVPEHSREFGLLTWAFDSLKIS
jgi:hypothetical protein